MDSIEDRLRHLTRQERATTFGALLRRYRRQRLHLNQGELADRLRVHRNTIGYIECGRVVPHQSTFERLRRAYRPKLRPEELELLDRMYAALMRQVGPDDPEAPEVAFALAL